MTAKACAIWASSLALLVAVPVAGDVGAWVTNLLDDSVSVIDTATNSVVATVPVGDGPEAVGVNPDNTRVYVANGAADTVSVIDVATNAVVATVPVGDNPQGVAVDPSGFWVYVVNNADKTVSVISAASNTVIATIPVGQGSLRAVVSADGNRLYVTNAGENNVSVIDTHTRLELTKIAVGMSPAGLDVTPDRTRLYVANTTDPQSGGGSVVGTVSVIDTTTNAVIKTIDVDSAEAVATNPAGSRVYVSQRFHSGVTAIDRSTDTVSASTSVGFLPRGLAVTPNGNRVLVANSSPNTVSVVETATNTVSGTVNVGRRPIAFGKFISPLTLLFADNFESGDFSKWPVTVGQYAGFLKANPGSAHSDAWGVAVTVGGTCTAPADRAITSPPVISGLFLACNSIAASGVEVGAPGATLAAGDSVTLGNDFVVGSGSPFIGTIDEGLKNGLAYLEWRSRALASFNPSFHLRLDGLAHTAGDQLELLAGYSHDGAVQFKVLLRYNAMLMENRLVLSVRQDSGAFVTTPAGQETLLPAGWNEIEIDWTTGPGSGSLLVSVNGAPRVGLTGIDNDAQRLGIVRLGYVGGTVTTTAGMLELDNFWSQL